MDQNYDEQNQNFNGTMAGHFGQRIQPRMMINVLFYIRLTDKKDDVVIKVLKESIAYILQEQNKVGRDVIGSIYMEEWAFEMAKKDLHKIMSEYPDVNRDNFI